MKGVRRTTTCLSALPLALTLMTGPALSQDSERESGPIDVTPAQVRAVDNGLRWLAERQNGDGSWTARVGYKLNEDYEYTKADRGHVGVTSLAAMAFLAGGHLPGRGEYGRVVERALDFVLASVGDDGYITASTTRMYSHAFATLFLAEIYGMTHRDDVRNKLQKAVDFIVQAQNAEGGWRYEPYAVDSDLSIVVCQVLALRAARNIGVRVPRSTVERAIRYVLESAVTNETHSRLGHPSWQYRNEIGSFRYQREIHSRSSFSLTAAGVTALHGLGVYSDDSIRRGVEHLQSTLHAFNSRYGVRQRGHYFFWYGHYYAVQAMYTMGSPYWEPYFREVRAVLLDLQRPDGSWPNGTGPGEIFSTSVAVLILEIPYRFLPIFQR